MGKAILEIDYYNSFWVKKVLNSNDEPVWPSIPENATTAGLETTPVNYPEFPLDCETSNTNAWFIEESRIQGNFNSLPVANGVRAYLNEDKSVQEDRQSSLIYSGIFNSRTGINNTNVFSVAEEITRSVDPAYGSIQYTHAEDTNLVVFQQSKVSQALIDKDAIYSSEGSGTPVTSVNQVIGTITPYLGRFGMSNNPESFAFFGFRKYFVDQNRGVVCRLSRDGITEISKAGMIDYFREQLGSYTNEFKEFTFVNTILSLPGDYNSIEIQIDAIDKNKMLKGAIFNYNNNDYIINNITLLDPVTNTYEITLSNLITVIAGTDKASIIISYKSRLLGGWDNHNRNYTLSIQETPEWINPNQAYETLSFDEDVAGWLSFYDYKPSNIFSTRNLYLTTINNQLWQHYVPGLTVGNANYLNFYGRYVYATVEFVINQAPSVKKNYQTVSYEGDNGWYISSLMSDISKENLEIGSNPAVYNVSNRDIAKPIISYESGSYKQDGYTFRAGFDRKENLYVANIVNETPASEAEVIFGNKMSGIKGFFLSATLRNDGVTDPNGAKEIWNVNTDYVISS